MPVIAAWVTSRDLQCFREARRQRLCSTTFRSIELDVAAVERGYKRPPRAGYSLKEQWASTEPHTRLPEAMNDSREFCSSRGSLQKLARRPAGIRRAQQKAQARSNTGRLGSVKRQLLESVVHEDPDPQSFEAWLLNYAESSHETLPSGAVVAMARAVLEEWRLAHCMENFKAWLDHGAPSADADGKAPAEER